MIKTFFKSKVSFALSLLVLGSLTVSSVAFAEPLTNPRDGLLSNGDDYTQSEMVIYVGDGCSHCAKVEAHVEEMDYENIFDLEFKEIYFDRGNALEYNQEASRLGLPITQRGVPMMVVENGYLSGDRPINYFLDAQNAMLEAKNAPVTPVDPVDPVDVDDPDGGIVDGDGDFSDGLTIGMVFGAAVVDAVNPCAFAVLIILLTTILSGGNRKRALYSGLLFSLAIFISYLAMGFGLYRALAISGISGIFMNVIATLAILLGLFNLKDFLWYGKGFKMEVPMSWRPKMKAVLQSVVSPVGAFVVGFLISLFLLPCTSGPYIVILSMLGANETFSTAAWLLVFYNVVFIAPMVLITLAVYKGFSVEKAEEMRQKKLKVLHLIAGVVLILMGLAIFLDVV